MARCVGAAVGRDAAIAVMSTHPTVRDVTDRIRERSAPTRGAYLAAARRRRRRATAAPTAWAAPTWPMPSPACRPTTSCKVVAERAPNIGIVTAYNDMLSAHAPLQRYPDLIKDEARRLGATAQVAGGVPAMCDGVTQGTPGMELSLFSRDVIAMAHGGGAQRTTCSTPR